MTDKERVDVYLPDELKRRVEDQLGYGDSLSAWMRDAAKERVNRERDEN